jgi:hypothetical protein
LYHLLFFFCPLKRASHSPLRAQALGFFENYDGRAFIVILANAVLGIATSYVYRYADALIKTFASACSAALLLGVSAMLFGLTLTLHSVAGAVVVLTASYIYVTAPKK